MSGPEYPGGRPDFLPPDGPGDPGDPGDPTRGGDRRPSGPRTPSEPPAASGGETAPGRSAQPDGDPRNPGLPSAAGPTPAGVGIPPLPPGLLPERGPGASGAAGTPAGVPEPPRAGVPGGGGVPEPPRGAETREGGSIWLGLLLSVVFWVVAGIGLTKLAEARVASDTVSIVGTVASVVWLVVALALTAVGRTRRTGAGMLIALGLVPIVFAGACVGLFAMMVP